MKRILALIIVLLLLTMTACSSKQKDITREEIVAAYEAAGYNVWTGTYDDMDSGIIAYIQAHHPNGDYIHLAFFETNAEAKAYEKDLDHPVMKGLFSIIFGEPSWERMETYGCIVVTYCDPDLFEPFEDLLKEK